MRRRMGKRPLFCPLDILCVRLTDGREIVPFPLLVVFRREVGRARNLYPSHIIDVVLE